MACFLPAIAANPLAPAIELSRGVPAEIVAATVGALFGVALFGVALVLFSRRKPRMAFQGASSDVVFVPPYPVVRGMWPPAPHVPNAGQGPAAAPAASGSAPAMAPSAPRLGFVPSTALSARAFAKLGYAFDGSSATRRVDDGQEPEELASSELEVIATGERTVREELVAAPESIPCMLESFPALASDGETGPMSAVTLEPAVAPADRRPTSSGLPAAAPIADLDVDDGPTQLCEPFFDEPPQPRRRGTPPKIRPIPPAPPRSAGEGPANDPTSSHAPRRGVLPVSGRASLPPVTTPPRAP